MPYFHNFPVTFYTHNGVDYDIVIDVIKRIKMRDLFLNDSFVYYEYSVKDSDTPEIIAEKYYGSPYYFWMLFFANQINDYNYDWVMDEDKFNRYLKEKYKTYTLSLNTNSTFELPESQDPIYSYIGYVKNTDNVNVFTPLSSCYVFSINNTTKKIKVIPAGGVVLSEGTWLEYGGLQQITNIEVNNNYEWYTFLSSYNHHYVNLDGHITTKDTPSATGVTFLDYEVEQNEKKRKIKIIDKSYLPQIEQEFKSLMGI
jgi:hypothetical protein